MWLCYEFLKTTFSHSTNNQSLKPKWPIRHLRNLWRNKIDINVFPQNEMNFHIHRMWGIYLRFAPRLSKQQKQIKSKLSTRYRLEPSCWRLDKKQFPIHSPLLYFGLLLVHNVHFHSHMCPCNNKKNDI